MVLLSPACPYFISIVANKTTFFSQSNIWISQVKSSGQMEVNACENLLNYLLSTGMKIRVYATDRSTTIRALMATKFQQIKHQFDIWSTNQRYYILLKLLCRHFNKGINKRLFKCFKLKSCPNLKAWQKSITNMVWWAISSSIGL